MKPKNVTIYEAYKMFINEQLFRNNGIHQTLLRQRRSDHRHLFHHRNFQNQAPCSPSFFRWALNSAGDNMVFCCNCLKIIFENGR